MEGAALAAEQAHNLAITTAWNTAIFVLKGYEGDLNGKKLSDYLVDSRRKRRVQTNEELLAAFQEMKAKGAPINIRQIN